MDLPQVCPVQRSSREHLIQEVNMSTLQKTLECQAHEHSERVREIDFVFEE